MSEIKNGIQMLKIDEVPDAVRTAILDEIQYSFNEKWNYYRKKMDNLDNEINELKRNYQKNNIKNNLIQSYKMPRTCKDYTKSVVYRIVQNHITLYIGSTTNFVKRKANHKSDCNNEKKKNINYPIYK